MRTLNKITVAVIGALMTLNSALANPLPVGIASVGVMNNMPYLPPTGGTGIPNNGDQIICGPRYPKISGTLNQINDPPKNGTIPKPPQGATPPQGSNEWCVGISTLCIGIGG